MIALALAFSAGGAFGLLLGYFIATIDDVVVEVKR